MPRLTPVSTKSISTKPVPIKPGRFKAPPPPPPPVHFSQSEARLLAILRKRNGRAITTIELIPDFYKDYPDGPPLYALESIVRITRLLEHKTQKFADRLGYRVRRSTRSGPYPLQVWIERLR